MPGSRPAAALVALLLAGCDPIGAQMAEALAPAADHPLQTWAWRQGPDGAWTRDPAPLAHGLSSLHAAVHDGLLRVTGLVALRPPGFWEERFPRLRAGTLTSGDGRAWTAGSWPVDAPGVSLIDPAVVVGPEGLELWFVQVDGLGDPAQGRRPTRIVRTRWTGRGFGGASVWAEGRGLVDPSPVWADGRWTVYATQDHAAVVEVGPDGATRPVLPGATVPFATADTLYAQAMVDGRMRAVVSRRGPDGAWSPPAVLFRDDRQRTCASPVVATVADAPLLLCVDERR